MPAVCQAMSRHAEMPVTPGDFQRTSSTAFAVSGHRRSMMKVRSSPKTASWNRCSDLRDNTIGNAGPESQDRDESWSREAMKSFDIDELPREVVRSRGGVRVAQYPGLVDLGDAVSTQLFPDETSAYAALRRGVTRLFAIAERKELRAKFVGCLARAGQDSIVGRHFGGRDGESPGGTAGQDRICGRGTCGSNAQTCLSFAAGAGGESPRPRRRSRRG